MERVQPGNRARVRIKTPDGKRKAIYLGKWGTKDAQQRYDEVIADYLRSERSVDFANLTLNRLCILYLQHAEKYYIKDGEPTSEVSATRIALREVVACCGTCAIRDFKPRTLKGVRDRMVANNWKRKSINAQVKRIVRMLAWGVENELVPPDVHAACKVVKSLARGRSEAVESEPVKPVDACDIEAVKEFVSRQVWGMIQLQLETGMRPQEARTLRLRDLDRLNAESWEYLPARHKTQHHGRDRRVYLNARAQAVVTPFLKAAPDAYLFSPRDAYEEAQERRKANRKTPMTPSHAARRPVPTPRKTAGELYTKDSYARAISRACEIAFEMPAGLSRREKSAWRKDHCWSPGQLRHNAATTFEREFGPDVARAILGHSSIETSRIYIEEDFEKARRAMEARA